MEELKTPQPHQQQAVDMANIFVPDAYGRPRKINQGDIGKLLKEAEQNRVRDLGRAAATEARIQGSAMP